MLTKLIDMSVTAELDTAERIVKPVSTRSIIKCMLSLEWYVLSFQFFNDSYFIFWPSNFTQISTNVPVIPV